MAALMKYARLVAASFLLALPLLVAACVSPQTPHSFLTPATTARAIDTVARTLAAEGQAPANVDREAKVVQTEWQNTGFGYGQVQGVNATIVRRYTVTFVMWEAGTNVTVRVDAKRCAAGDVRGACEEASGIPGSMQKDLDALAAKLRAALAARRTS